MMSLVSSCRNCLFSGRFRRPLDQSFPSIKKPTLFEATANSDSNTCKPNDWELSDLVTLTATRIHTVAQLARPQSTKSRLSQISSYPGHSPPSLTLLWPIRLLGRWSAGELIPPRKETSLERQAQDSFMAPESWGGSGGMC